MRRTRTGIAILVSLLTLVVVACAPAPTATPTPEPTLTPTPTPLPPTPTPTAAPTPTPTVDTAPAEATVHAWLDAYAVLDADSLVALHIPERRQIQRPGYESWAAEVQAALDRTGPEDSSSLAGASANKLRLFGAEYHRHRTSARPAYVLPFVPWPTGGDWYSARRRWPGASSPTGQSLLQPGHEVGRKQSE